VKERRYAVLPVKWGSAVVLYTGLLWRRCKIGLWHPTPGVSHGNKMSLGPNIIAALFKDEVFLPVRMVKSLYKDGRDDGDGRVMSGSLSLIFGLGSGPIKFEAYTHTFFFAICIAAFVIWWI